MSSDSTGWWLSFGNESGEAAEFEFDASGALSATGHVPAQASPESEKDSSAIALGDVTMDIGAVEDMLVEGLNGTAAGDQCNAEDRREAHSADMGSSNLATERHEDKDSLHSAAGAHTTRGPQALTPLGMLPRSIRRKNVRRSSGTSRKHSAVHGPAVVPWNGSGNTMPLPCPPAGASRLQIPIMAASFVIARETHWAQSQWALQYATCAQLYENGLRSYPHIKRGPAALQGPQTPMAVFEPYRHCFFPPHYNVHQQPQTRGQRKAKITATTRPQHPDQDKQAEGGGGGGCSGPGEETSGVRGKRQQLLASSTAQDVHASTNVQPQRNVIAQVKACARTNNRYRNCYA